jgi:hypothetical protein
MSMSKHETVKALVILGNDIRGHRVSGKNKAEIKTNVGRVFANAREKINHSQYIVG